MTEDQQDKFAEKVAIKILKQFLLRSIEIQNGSYRIISKKEGLENELEALREELAEYLQDEEYSKAEKTSKEIDKVVKKLKDL